MNQATSPSNICNKVSSLGNLDRWLAIIVFMCSGFILLPLIYEVGRAAVQSLPRSVSSCSEKGTPKYRLKKLAQAANSFQVLKRRVVNDLNNELDALLAFEDVENDDTDKEKVGNKEDDAKVKGGGTSEGAKTVSVSHVPIPTSQHFRGMDVALWLPSFFAPDLWIAGLSNMIVRKLNMGVPRDLQDADDKRISSSSSRSRDSSNAVLTVSICRETEFVKRHLGCILHSDGLLLSVLVPLHEDDENEFDNDASNGTSKALSS
jgi:hypothetical protein